MSAFVVVYECSNTPLDPGVFERAMQTLKHRGPDGRDILLTDRVALGHWHFWTTPEEVGERQPLKLSGLPFSIVLDGRLDNRVELCIELGMEPAVGKSLSDAALILSSYARWSTACLDHLIGDFAMVILDESLGQLFCARDALGERSLFYAWHGTRLVLASEPWAVASAGGLLPELNENVLPYRLLMKATHDGQTLFKHVYELLPAHGILVTASGSRSWRYWQPNPVERLRGKADADYADEFRVLLENSVRCRMRSITPVGVQMSGGLDSGSVACLAARILAHQPLTTISYIFDELADCDERSYIEALKKHSNLYSIQFVGDNFGPFSDFENAEQNFNQPPGNPFQPLIEQVYQIAQQEGLRVLLTGGGGDQLYGASVNWLADLVGEGRLWEAGQNLFSHLRSLGWRTTLKMGILQRVGTRFLDSLLGTRYLHRRRSLPSWLTPLACEAFQKSEKDIPFEDQYSGLLGKWVASLYSSEAFFAARFNLELRRPYRDRRLAEFVLGLPGYQLYNHGLYKYILRTALQDILPEAVRMRNRPTPFNSLFLRGFKMKKTVLQDCIQNPGAIWRKFVRSDWLVKQSELLFSSGNFRREDVVLWACISFDAWHHSIRSFCSNEAP